MGYSNQLLIGTAIEFAKQGRGAMESWTLPSTSTTLQELLAEEYMVCA